MKGLWKPVLLVALLALCGGVYFLKPGWLPPPSATLIAEMKTKGQGRHVLIRRDEDGVPHILGHTDADAAFGIAYAHSEDDFETIQDTVLATRGRLGAYRGAKSAPVDYLVQWMQIWPSLEDGYDRLPADVRAVLEAYADGVNLYAARHPEKMAPELLPVTGKDVAAGFMLKTPFFYGLPDIIQEVLKPTHGKPASPIGSNGLALAPSRTSDGATRLLVNSHQPYTGPVAWYEAVVQSEEGLHVAGGFFPGSPFMLHGHNEHLGWANTVNKPKLVDLYALVTDKAHPGQYRLDGVWRPFERTDAKLTIRILGPLTFTLAKPVLRSEQGPVLETDHGTFAVRYAGMGETRQAVQYYRLDKAKDRDDWLAAMRLQALPSINYIFADAKGEIGYVYNGQFPDRKPGFENLSVLPGDRSDLIWKAYLPFSMTPQIWNPKSGYVFNSNNTPFAATAPEDGLRPQDFPAFMGLETGMTNRAYRVQETFGEDARITPDAFLRYKFDVRYSQRSSMARLVKAILALPSSSDPDVAQAQAILRAWDLSADRNSRGAALAVLTAMPLSKALEKGETPDPTASLNAAIQRLKTHFGRLDPLWGEVNRIRRGAVDLPIDGGPDTYRAAYGAPDRDGRQRAEAGDTFIMVVSFDRQGVVSSRSIHQFGSATLDATSPHYADQTPLFAAEQLKPVWFTEKDLTPHIRATYAP